MGKFMLCLPLIALMGCGQPLTPTASLKHLGQLDESGSEFGRQVTTAGRTLSAFRPAGMSSSPVPAQASSTTQSIEVEQATNLRFKKDGVFEFAYELPPGSRISFPSSNAVDNSPYRSTNGKTARNSTGFMGPVLVQSISTGLKTNAAKIVELNKRSGGIFVAASVVNGKPDLSGTFPPLPLIDANPDYSKLFAPGGQPLFRFSGALKSKFGFRLNQLTKPNAADKAKFKAIFNEMQKVASREVAVAKTLLLMNPAQALAVSKGTAAPAAQGAWSIAVMATAKLHGFVDTPCAEFVSEELREAYKRAGFDASEDFNAAKGNELIWKSTAAVSGLSAALVKAGWTPWSTKDFAPPVGAILLNGVGETPGHAYLAAGANGRFIVDNGSPQGRDLGITKAHTLGIMYKGGVFFLPPGLQPLGWANGSSCTRRFGFVVQRNAFGCD